MYLKSLLFISFAAFATVRSDDVLDTNAVKKNLVVNPYDLVSKCTPSILSRAYVDFDITEVTNIGKFQVTHIVLGPQDLTCAIAVFYGDKKVGFQGYATNLKRDGTTSTTVYTFPNINNGVIDEVLTVTKPDGTQTTYEFKIVVNKWDKTAGVMHLSKCSDFGTSATDIRTIILQDCKYNNGKSRWLANKFASDDAKAKFNGPNLIPLKRCPENMN